MGVTTQQGTRWESRIVQSVRKLGRSAARLPKTGKKNEPDLIIPGKKMRAAVAWERWKGSKSKGRRRAVRMITVTEEHYYELLDNNPEFGYYVQCKSTQAGSVSAWLEGLIERMEQDEGQANQ